MIERNANVVILGGGPGGYEAALVAAHLGAKVTVVDRDGLGGAAVLTDCVPSKALVSAAHYMEHVDHAADVGIHLEDPTTHRLSDAELDDVAVADLAAVNKRIMALAGKQSEDIEAGLVDKGVRIIRGTGRLVDATHVVTEPVDGSAGETLEADTILVAVGATPRVLPTAQPDGERIMTWKQIWSLTEVPEHLVVVGSGVTGAELAAAYLALGAKVTLVSSREHVLPGEDQDAAKVIEDVFRRNGMIVLNKSRATSVERQGEGVLVTLDDGRTVEASHCIMAVGSIPNTQGIGLEEIGVQLAPSGHIEVDRVSRTSVRGVYAAGDCTALLPLASVAAMQGRTAIWHSLGDAVAPINVQGVCSTIFTDPEIATVGMSQREVDEQGENVRSIMMSLSTNPRAKMEDFTDGFVKLFCSAASGIVLGGVVVAPKASELIFPLALAVNQRLTVDQVSSTMTVYPSMSGSVAEAARRLHSVM